MRQLFVTALVLVCCVSMVFADGFYGLHSPNGNEVWAVGKTGSVFRSFDGGATWGSYPMGLFDLRSVFSLGSSVWMVGDGGAYYWTTDSGANWSNQTLNSGVRLNAVLFVNATNGWACGNFGSIIATTDGGATWNGQTSGTAQHLHSLSFANATTGYASGAAGTLLKTTDGGATWTNSAGGGWTKDILSVGTGGSSVYAVGVDGFARKSTDDGATWSILPKFYTDSRSDVTGVHVLASDTALFIGGGGFIRKTNDAGATSTWGQHGLHASLTDIYCYDSQKGWAVSDKNNAIMRTTNGGATWSLPTGTTVTTNWVQKTMSGSIGNTFMVNPWNKNYFYQVSGSTVRMSADRGETWAATATITGGGSAWSFYISPKDTNIWVVATSASGKGVKRSTDRGVTWTQTIARNFTSYGMPLEMHPDRPDTLLFAAEQTGIADARIYISTDFGATWDTLSTTGMRSPCDIYIVPDSSNIVYIGDGITGVGEGKMWRSTDGGVTWTVIYTNASGVSEIPMVGGSRLRPSDGYATGWGGGGFKKSSDGGASWTTLIPTGSSWGVDVAKDDPNVVMYGLYGGGTSYLSTNAGTSFSSKALSGSNSGMLAYDRATFLVHQAGDGIWKYTFSYTVPVSNTQAVTVTSPNGGEGWSYSSMHNITWTASNFANVNIDYQTSSGGSWIPIATGVMASAGSYAWNVPNVPTTQARIRVIDAGDSNPQDSSNAAFSILVAAISSTPSSVNFGTVDVGAPKQDTVRIYNTGTGTLVVSSVTNANAQITPGRTSFSIPAGSSDTLSITYAPTSGGVVEDTLIIANNTPGGSLTIPLAGNAVYVIPEPVSPPDASNDRSANDTLTWNSVPGSLSYHLQIAGDTSFASPSVDDSTLAGTSHNGSFPLGSTNYWRVRAITTEGPTAWSQVWHFTVTSIITLQQSATDGWNLISVPLEVTDASKASLYPTSVSNAYSYSASGYGVEDTLANGVGYWLKFSGAETIDITGSIRPSDTVNVEVGWNMIGSLSSPVATAAIIEVPSGIVQSAYYGYNGAYNSADTLHPSLGYWVKASAAGQLILGSGAFAVPAKPAGIIPATKTNTDVASPKKSKSE